MKYWLIQYKKDTKHSKYETKYEQTWIYVQDIVYYNSRLSDKLKEEPCIKFT